MPWILLSLILLTVGIGLYVFLPSSTSTDSLGEATVDELRVLEAELDALPTPAPTTTEVAEDFAATTTLDEPVSSPAPAADTQAVATPPPIAQTETTDRSELIDQIAQLRLNIADQHIKVQRPYIDIVNPSGFVNSEPFTLADLVGDKVILLKFTTYSCINCQRTYPYVIDWHNSYADEGLAVIAIHTPEFSFEKNIDNVRAAMQKEGITFPVVLDNDFATWNAYGNRFWPRLYLIDINGDIVYDHIGEGAYEITETVIQELLAQRKEKLGA